MEHERIESSPDANKKANDEAERLHFIESGLGTEAIKNIQGMAKEFYVGLQYRAIAAASLRRDDRKRANEEQFNATMGRFVVHFANTTAELGYEATDIEMLEEALARTKSELGNRQQ